MNTLEILKAARELIAQPEHWTTEGCARDKNGLTTDCLLPEAFSFCSFGAVYRVTGGDNALLDKAERVLDRHMNGNLVPFNDRHSHSEVLAAWDKAIESVK